MLDPFTSIHSSQALMHFWSHSHARHPNSSSAQPPKNGPHMRPHTLAPALHAALAVARTRSGWFFRATSLPGEAVGPGDLPAPWDPISLDQLLQGLARGDTNTSGPFLAPQRNSGKRSCKRNGLEDWLGLDGTGVRTRENIGL